LLLAFWPRVCFALALWLCTKLDNIRPIFRRIGLAFFFLDLKVSTVWCFHHRRSSSASRFTAGTQLLRGRSKPANCPANKSMAG